MVEAESKLGLTNVVYNRHIALASLNLKTRMMIPKLLLALCTIRLIWDLCKLQVVIESNAQNLFH